MGDNGVIVVKNNVKVMYTTSIYFPNIDLTIALHLEREDFPFDAESFTESGENRHLRIPVGKNVLIQITSEESILVYGNGEIYICRENTVFENGTCGEKKRRSLKSMYVDKLKLNTEDCEKMTIERMVNNNGEVEFVKCNVENTLTIRNFKPSATVTGNDCAIQSIKPSTNDNHSNSKTHANQSVQNANPLVEHVKDSSTPLPLVYSCNASENNESRFSETESVGLQDKEIMTSMRDGEKSVKRFYKCFLCKKFQCETNEELEAHRSADHSSEKPGSRYKCMTCGNTYSKLNDYRFHVRKHIHKKPFQCKECGDRFATYSFLCKHSSKHKDHQPLICSLCGRRFRSAATLKVHILRHNGVKPHKCDECDRRFLYPHQVELHKQYVHSDQVGPYLCDMCGKDFVQRPALKSHLKKQHGLESNEEQTRKCDNCTLNKNSECTHQVIAFKRTERRRVNISKKNYSKLRVSTGGKKRRFPCTFCGVTYCTAKILAAHVNTVHVLKAKYLCKYCQMPFQDRNDIIKHVRTVHEEERRFQCEFCSKRFFKLGHIITHSAIHKNQKAFTCSVCGKSFNLKNNLKAHELLHSGKVYQCMACEERLVVKAGVGGREQKETRCEKCGSSTLKLVRNVAENLKLLT